jgi:ribosomal protein S18 acetylase RimI-like enzyme
LGEKINFRVSREHFINDFVIELQKMPVVFFKRYRMQFDLRYAQFDESVLPAEYDLIPWRSELLNAHAEAKFRSFRNELDANVFPCLGAADGCLRLMKEISNRQGFVPQATWLATHRNPKSGRLEYCGTVQGLREKLDVGAIQNVGVARDHRGMGLGSAIVRKSLKGFQASGIKIVTLEVTEKNTGALRLYQRLGFEVVSTVFKSVEVKPV